MKEIFKKTETLIEALPYIKQYAGSTFVIKYGGHAMTDEALKRSFADDIVLLKFVGIHPVVVHGGGPQIDRMLKRLNIASTFIDGMRVTDEDTLDVAEMVLGGTTNKSIVNLINMAGGMAVGLTGKDARLFTAKKYYIEKKEKGRIKKIDIGHVGIVDHVNPDIIEVLKAKDYIPVIAPIGFGTDGESYNINADLVASRVASALGAVKLILMTDTQGVLDNDKKLISSLNGKKAKSMVAKGAIAGGMIPKVNFALEAVGNGIDKVHIIDGRIPHALLLEIFTYTGIGTEVIQ